MVMPPKKKVRLKYFPINATEANDSQPDYVLYYNPLVWEDRIYFECNTIKLFPDSRSPRDPEIVASGIAKYRDDFISKQIHKDLASGRCKYLILDHSLEGNYEIDWDYISTITGVEKSKLVWLTAVWNPEFMNRQSDVTVCFTNQWERWTSRIHPIKYNPQQLETDSFPWTTGFEQQLKDCGDRKKRPYYGLLYNRAPKLTRAVLLARLKEQGLLTNTSYSWLGWHRKKRKKRKSDEQLFVDSLALGTLREQDKDAFMEIANLSNVSISADENLQVNLAFNLNFNHVSDCYFQIIAETDIFNALVDDATPYLTEKSFKPFISGMPFVVWGQKGNIQALREQGYDVFDNWINHDYDNIVNEGERLAALMKEIERLYLWTHNEWTQHLSDMIPIFKNNYQNIHKRSNDDDFKYHSFRTLTNGVSDVKW